FAVLIAAVLYRILVLKQAAFGGSVGGIPLAVRLQTAPRLLLSYVALPCRFAALTICDDYRLSLVWQAVDSAALFIVVALSALVVLIHKREPHITLGTVWMIAAVLPVLNIVPLLHYRADRFFYLPLLGWALAVVCVARRAAMAFAARAGVEAARLG